MSLVTNFEPFQSAKAQADLSATLWATLRREAEDAFARERALAPIIVNSILNRTAFEDAVIHRISARLGNEIVPAYLLNDAFGQAVAGDETIGAGFRADIEAGLYPDPACEREIGACSLVAAGSVVLHSVPPNTTVAGVPARAVGTAGCAEPSRNMNQILSQLAYDSFTYTI